MASSDAEIKDGRSLSLWMRNKPAVEFEPFAASPPGPEDSFFYIRYPKSDALFGNTQTEQAGPILTAVKDRDWSKHTKPCQEVMHGVSQINPASVNSVKATGAEEGGKGEACGSSVVKVAHQMLSASNRSVSQRGFTVATPEEDDEGGAQYHSRRRGSKSLPTSPLHTPPTSPNSRRKVYGNRYFTSPFEQKDDAVQGRSWLSMALLGFKKDINASTSTLAEEDTLEIRLHGSLAESVESLGPAPRKDRKIAEIPTQEPKLTKPAHSFRPKPSELREMNFWSPTSM